MKKDIKKATKKLGNEISETINKATTDINDKAQRINAYRRKASALASKANKRLQRLEKGNLKDSPAYKQAMKSGGRFGVRGKTYNQVQAEVSRLNRFLGTQTSTVRGVNANLKAMAKNTGVEYKNMKDLRKKATKFFALASKVEQYLRTVEDMASAIGYQKIWKAINTYTKDSKINLASGKADIDSMIASVTSAIKEYEQPVKLPDDGWFKLT